MSALPPSTLLAPAWRLPAARSDADYRLAVPTGERLRLARGWLWLGLGSLIGAGLLAIVLVFSRTPGINGWLRIADLFHVALVVHVDLSVLVWFVSLAGMLWSLSGGGRYAHFGRLALGLAGAGALAMTVSSFTGGGEPIMSNYIPMLTAPLFIGGLLVFAASVALLVARSLLDAPKLGLAFDGQGALRFGLNAAAVATAVALLAFGWSWAVLPESLDSQTYYEILFWGGGHALQFTWTLLMLVAWLWLASECGGRIPLSPRVTVLMFGLALASVFATPVAYLAYDITSVEHRAILTWAMRLGGGISLLPVGLAVVFALHDAPPPDPKVRPLRAALVASLLLFATGGLIGVFISGSNVRIPAHYHGCIVGVTLALMGLVLRLLPALGYAAPQGRLATSQPWVYAVGQLLHIAGLVWSGGYGVQRKVAGAEQVLHTPGEIAGMGLMGLGGAIAIVGGLLFVVVVLRSMRAAADPPLSLRASAP
ncbi:MAG TPA: cbb3-type cytochrome c oxidase subunit I [Ramlibacter sp.]|nr:cbb3-type cytochrome c oxidase subunit I [Ramlibacter sp.]